MLRRAIFSSALSGAPPVVQANTLGLNGTNQYLRFTPLEPNPTAFSFSFRFRAGDTSGIQMLMSQFDGGNASVNRRLFYVWLNGTTLQAAIRSDAANSVQLSKSSININIWYSVACVYDGVDFKLYVDNIGL